MCRMCVGSFGRNKSLIIFGCLFFFFFFLTKASFPYLGYITISFDRPTAMISYWQMFPL